MGTPEYRLVVCGEGGVGKSAISVQYISAHFVEVYDPTIEDSYRKQISVDEQVALVHIRDTAGQEQYSCLRESWYRDGEGFLLVYAINDRKSFLKLREHVKQIERVRDVEDIRGKAPLMLFGNKLDLAGQRQVPTEEAQAYAAEMAAGFLEGSAKKFINLNEAFEYLVRAIRKFREPKEGRDATSGVKDSEGRMQRSGSLSGKRKGGCTIL